MNEEMMKKLMEGRGGMSRAEVGNSVHSLLEMMQGDKKPSEPKDSNVLSTVIETFVRLAEDKLQGKINSLEAELEYEKTDKRAFEKMADERAEALKKTIEELNSSKKEITRLNTVIKDISEGKVTNETVKVKPKQKYSKTLKRTKTEVTKNE